MSDSQPSFRTFVQSKVKKVIKPNITSSIREHIKSEDAYEHLREKYHNLTDTIKDQPSIQAILNKTKEYMPNPFSSNDNQTSPKGFYDSIFSAETEQDVYFKVAIICLWIVAMLFIIPTIITTVIPVSKYHIRPTGVKMIFLHILLCEFFYLVYIFLSMINVALDFQLASIFCRFANYGMYVTIPVMHFALLCLSMERLSKRINSPWAWTCIFKKSYIIQIILVASWILLIALTATILLMKQYMWSYSTNLIRDKAPSIFSDVVNKVVSRSYQCSIDGRLSTVFKILFIILFVVLIVLIIKGIATSVLYTCFTPKCIVSKKKPRTSPNERFITLLFVIFLALNICFSFPFYFASMATTFEQLVTRKNTYSTSLKVCFVLRILSIIFQCLTFNTLENDTWILLSKLLFLSTCKKIHALNPDDSSISTVSTPVSDREPQKPLKVRQEDKYRDLPSSDSESDSDSDENGPNLGSDDDSLSDDVFGDEPKHESPVTKKSKTKTDRNGVENKTELAEKNNAFTRQNTTTEKSHERRHRIEPEKIASQKPTLDKTNTTDKTQKLDKIKPTSEPISITTDKTKTSKPNPDHSKVHHRSRRISSSTSSSSASQSDVGISSDDEIKQPKIETATTTNHHDASTHQEHTKATIPHTNQTRIFIRSPRRISRHKRHSRNRRLESSQSTNNRRKKAKPLLDKSDDV